jgi:hypothetical protein
MRIAVRAIVIAAWIIRGPVKDRNRDRYWQTETEEDPGLRLGLSQQRDSKDQRQYDNKFFHIVTSADVKFDFRLRHAAKGIVGTVWARRRAVRLGQSRWNEGAMQCKVIIAVGVCILLANRRLLDYGEKEVRSAFAVGEWARRKHPVPRKEKKWLVLL